MKIDYTVVTERPGQKATEEQIGRIYHRYHFASQFCDGKDVLEVACGAGIGLGYFARNAKIVIGGDRDEDNLKIAWRHYKDRKNITFALLNAHTLPFKDKHFDIVLLFEAIYYLSDVKKFIGEARRVLRDNGKIIICTVNRDLDDFHASLYSTRYFSVPELHHLLRNKFYKIEIFGAFITMRKAINEKMISLIKRLAVILHIMPGTMRGKEIFKRIFFGKLISLPPEIKGGDYKYLAPEIIPVDLINRKHKIIYAIGHLSVADGVEH